MAKRARKRQNTRVKLSKKAFDLRKENAEVRRKLNEVSRQPTGTADARPSHGLALLRNNILFHDLPASVLDHLGSYMKTRKVAKGATIFSKGDPGTGLLGVLAGTVKVGVVDATPPYLRTHADGVWTDNLLALPRY